MQLCGIHAKSCAHCRRAAHCLIWRPLVLPLKHEVYGLLLDKGRMDAIRAPSRSFPKVLEWHGSIAATTWTTHARGQRKPKAHRPLIQASCTGGAQSASERVHIGCEFGWCRARGGRLAARGTNIRGSNELVTSTPYLVLALGHLHETCKNIPYLYLCLNIVN